MTLALPVSPEANELLTRSPLALVIGLVLDQQDTLEKAFTSPYVLTQRLGHEPTAEELANFDPEALAVIFSGPPALHRFPKSMAARVQQACRTIIDEYDGKAERVWLEAADGKDLVKRIEGLPGFGKRKAEIFGAFLGKQLDVRPPGWREATAGFGDEGTYLSIADIVDDESLGKVREHKKQMKAAAKAAKD